jgi:hypothetical protein
LGYDEVNKILFYYSVQYLYLIDQTSIYIFLIGASIWYPFSSCQNNIGPIRTTVLFECESSSWIHRMTQITNDLYHHMCNVCNLKTSYLRQVIFVFLCTSQFSPPPFPNQLISLFIIRAQSTAKIQLFNWCTIIYHVSMLILGK